MYLLGGLKIVFQLARKFNIYSIDFESLRIESNGESGRASWKGRKVNNAEISQFHGRGRRDGACSGISTSLVLVAAGAAPTLNLYE